MDNDASHKTWDDNVGYAWPSEPEKPCTDQGTETTVDKTSTTPTSTPPNTQQVGGTPARYGTTLTHGQLYEKNKENRKPGSNAGQHDGRNGSGDNNQQLKGEDTKGNGSAPHPPVVD